MNPTNDPTNDRTEERVESHPAEGAYLVREARGSDASAIVRYQIAHAGEVESLELDPRDVEAGVEAVFSREGLGRYFVVEDRARGGIVACLLVLSEWSDWRAGEVWWIHSVYVDPAHRGRGLFVGLFRRVEELARASGAKGLRLYVDKGNARAKAIYAGLGMSNAHYELFETLF